MLYFAQEMGLMEHLRTIRRNKLYSIRDLADVAGIAPSTLHEIELGRTVPRLRTMRKICQVLGVDPMAVVEFAKALTEQEGGEA